jgi:hypothetical protein
MGIESKLRAAPDSFMESPRTEITSGSRLLSAWIQHVQAKNGIDVLFAFETWIRGLCSYFDVGRLPLDEGERAAIVTRNFAPETRTARLALQLCTQSAQQLSHLSADAAVEGDSGENMKPGARDPQSEGPWAPASPLDSLESMMDAIADLESTMEALYEQSHQNLKLFLSFGRTFQRALQSSRYIHMLLAQRFRLQYDRMDHPLLSDTLKSIQDDSLRRNLTFSLLYLYRSLRYLKLVAGALEKDRPLRGYLVIFSLLHEQSEALCDFLKSRLTQGNDPRLKNVPEGIEQSIRMAIQRVFERELRNLTSKVDPAILYTKVENSHGILRNVYQDSVLKLVQAFDGRIDGKSLFPSMLEGAQQGQKLKGDLWDLRQDLQDELEKSAALDLSRVLDRIARFRESSLRLLMYQDWGEFEGCSERLITAGNEVEVRILLRKFVAFLDVLIQEVSKRRVLQ